VDEPVDSMDDVGGQGGIAAVDPMGSSVMEDSCALEIDVAPVENEALDEVVNKQLICRRWLIKLGKI
jgi:hypothetical protein